MTPLSVLAYAPQLLEFLGISLSRMLLDGFIWRYTITIFNNAYELEG